MRFSGPQTERCLHGFLIGYSFFFFIVQQLAILTSCKFMSLGFLISWDFTTTTKKNPNKGDNSRSFELENYFTRIVVQVHSKTCLWQENEMRHFAFVPSWNTVTCVSLHRDLQGNGYTLYTMDDKHCYCGNLDPAQLAGTFQCLQCRKRFHAGDWTWLTDWTS